MAVKVIRGAASGHLPLAVNRGAYTRIIFQEADRVVKEIAGKVRI